MSLLPVTFVNEALDPCVVNWILLLQVRDEQYVVEHVVSVLRIITGAYFNVFCEVLALSFNLIAFSPTYKTSAVH